MAEPTGTPEFDTGAPTTPPRPSPGPARGDDGAGATTAPQQPGPPQPPTLSLPKGGGAIRGIGEKFTVAPATGTASVAVPVLASAGRGGFGPVLALTYDSGNGNGPFGLGWKLAMPSITRKTDRGLPRYLDDPDQDTFIFSGLEDLVPVRGERHGRFEQVSERRRFDGMEFSIYSYHPRIEGAFARIERWRELESGETHWRTITAENVTTLYGTRADSRIADPEDPTRVFTWLISESHDDTGNVVVYDYIAEDGRNVETGLACERNRTQRSRSAARYPKRIRYGNRRPWAGGRGPGSRAGGGDPDWMFEVVFDYGDHRERDPGVEPDHPWPCRPDPFSSYRSTFEIRTYRRCHRILSFHHFPDEPEVGSACLISSTDIAYRDTGESGMTTVASVRHTGYRRRRDRGYYSSSLPPLEFDYTPAMISRRPEYASGETLENLPVGIDQGAYQLVDLNGEGLAGVLSRQAGAWFYKPNQGDGRFASKQILALQPSLGAPGHRQELLDLSGDGRMSLAELGGPTPGFYRRRANDGWHSFRPFGAHPDIGWDDPDLRLVDIDGDGLADVLITHDDAFTWYPSLGPEGFGDGTRTYQPGDEERGPRLILADPEQSVYLADMSGDGLSDLVRVRNGEICYWPNIGYGRFGTKVTMDHSPWMDKADQFNQRRVPAWPISTARARPTWSTCTATHRVSTSIAQETASAIRSCSRTAFPESTASRR